MSFEIERYPKEGELSVENAGSKEELFGEVVEALNELCFGDTGNDVYKIELRESGIRDLLLSFLRELKVLQDAEDLQIGMPKSISIEKDHESLDQFLEAEIFMDKRTGRKYWPVKEIRRGSFEFDYESGEGWLAGFKVFFDTEDRETPQTDFEF